MYLGNERESNRERDGKRNIGRKRECVCERQREFVSVRKKRVRGRERKAKRGKKYSTGSWWPPNSRPMSTN